MALRTIVVRFNTNVSTYSADMRIASSANEKLAKTYAKIQHAQANGLRTAQLLAQKNKLLRESATSMLAAYGKLGLTLGAVTVVTLGAAIKSFVAYERTMKNVQSISVAFNKSTLNSAKSVAVYENVLHRTGNTAAALAAANNEEFENLNKQIEEMAMNSAFSATELGEAFYEIASAGFFGARAVDILTQANIAASAGLTDVKTAAQGLLFVLNAYGDAAPSVARINDILFQTVRVGVIRFEQLIKQMGQFTGIAAVTGIEVKELGAAIATMTRAGIPAEQSGTALNRVLTTLLKPSKDLTSALQQAGIQNVQTALQTDGLYGVMQKLYRVTGDNTAAWVKLFPQFRAARGALALITQQTELYGDVVKNEFTNLAIAGSAARAYAKQQESLAFQIDRARNAANVFAIQLGRKFVPVVKFATNAIYGLSSLMSAMPEGAKTATATFAGLGGTVVALGGGLLALQPMLMRVGTALDAVSKRGVDVGVFMKHMNLLLVGITAALAIGAFALQKWGKAQADRKAALEELRPALKADEEAAKSGASALNENTMAVHLNRIARTDLLDITKKLEQASQGLITAGFLAAAEAGDKDAQERITKGFEAILDLGDQQIAMFTDTGESAAQFNNTLASGLKGNRSNLKEVISLVHDLAELESGEATGTDRFSTRSARGGGQARSAAREYLDDLMNRTGLTATQIEKSLKDVDKAFADNAVAIELNRQAQKLENEQAAISHQRKLDQVDGLGFLTEATDEAGESTVKLTESEKELVKAFESFLDISDSISTALGLNKTITDAIKNAADSATDFLDKVKDDRKSADEQAADERVKSLEKEFEETKRIDEDRYEDIKKRADQEADKIEQRAKNGSQRRKERAKAEADAIREAAEDEIDADKRRKEDAMEARKAELEKEKKLADERNETLKLSTAQYIDALTKQANANKKWVENIQKIRNEAAILGLDATGLIESLAEMGDEGKDLAQQFADGGRKVIASGINAVTGLKPVVQASFGEWKRELQRRLKEFGEWQADLRTLAASGHSELAKILAREGIEGKDLVKAAIEQVKKNPKELDDLEQSLSKVNLQLDPESVKVFEQELDFLSEIARTNAPIIKPEDMSDAEWEIFKARFEDHLDELPDEVKVNVVLSFDVPSVTYEEELNGNTMTIRPRINYSKDDERYQYRPNNPQYDPNADPNNPLKTTRRTARGGILYARGGIEDHTAQIAKAGAWRLWAEPETGGEAYIPLAMAKRARSMDILSKVAQIFGMALAPQARGSYSGRSRNTEFNSNGESSLWADAMALDRMRASTAIGNAMKVIVVHVPVPEKIMNETNLIGTTIQGINMDDAIKQAQRIARRKNSVSTANA